MKDDFGFLIGIGLVGYVVWQIYQDGGSPIGISPGVDEELSTYLPDTGDIMQGSVTPQQVYALAKQLISAYGFNVTANMATSIAIVESGDVNNPANGLNPAASRFEIALNDSSVGLMQTLTSTAAWLATTMGYSAMGVPTSDTLSNPTMSMYFGLAYLDYLSKYTGKQQNEGFIVQSYNAGPGNSSSVYFTKYEKAQLWLEQNGMV